MAELNANNTPTEDLLKQHLEDVLELLNKQRLQSLQPSLQQRRQHLSNNLDHN